jgi:hypothetical protein
VSRRLLLATIVILGFVASPAGAGAPPPTITATPSSGLVDGQMVTVEGDGFAPDTIYEIFECAGDSVDEMRCDPRNAFELDSDGAGRIVFDLRVDARIYLGPEGETSYDCRTEPAGCRIGVGYILDHDLSAFAALGFDPDAPLVPPVSATVQPTEGLVDGQIIHVRGENLSDLEQGWIIQCRAGGAPRECDLDREVRLVPGPDGTIEADLPVRATFRSPLGDDVDCRARAAECAVVVSWGFAFVADRFDEVPISFAAAPTTVPTTSPPTTPPTSAIASPTTAAPSLPRTGPSSGLAVLCAAFVVTSAGVLLRWRSRARRVPAHE